MRVGLSVREGERLFSALLPTTTDAGGARYPELVELLRSNNAKWYEAERGIAHKVSGGYGRPTTPIVGGFDGEPLPAKSGGALKRSRG